MRRVRLSAAVLVAASLVLAGCGGDEEPSEDSPAAQEIAGGSTLDSTWPLTGLPVEGDDSAAQTHPVMVTKIDNTDSSAPQIGLGSADMVVEELVEGGLTRLAVFYLLRAAGQGRPGPLDARQRHRHRLARSTARSSPVALPARPSPGSRAPASSSSRRAPRASTATAAGARRTTCSRT